MNDDFSHRKIDVGEVSLHIAEAGPPDGELVIFLHGFPEFWWSWRHQLKAFGDAGYHAVAPDMRGYNDSDKPEGVAAYEIEKLAGDVAGLIKALGRDKAMVVGHDWGAVVAWGFAMLHPEMLVRLGICNVPHPLQMTRGLKTLKQLRKSWYMFFFQIPFIPEKGIAASDYATVRKGFLGDGLPADEIEPYIDALKKPNAVHSAVNYYRAAIRRVLTNRLPTITKIEKPVLVIWGDQDRYLGKELADPPPRFVPNARTVHIPEASHWVQNIAPQRVNELLLEFAKS